MSEEKQEDLYQVEVILTGNIRVKGVLTEKGLDDLIKDVTQTKLQEYISSFKLGSNVFWTTDVLLVNFRELENESNQ